MEAGTARAQGLLPREALDEVLAQARGGPLAEPVPRWLRTW